MLPTALVPVRIAPTAKKRLAHVLGPDERMALITALFEHVTSTLSRAGLRVIALSPVAVSTGVEVWTDEAPGLNAAVDRALQRLGCPAFVVHADLPILSVEDVDAVLACEEDIVIARAHDGGTNGLLLREPLRPAFGLRSALVHAARARAAGLSACVVDVCGFAADIDTEQMLTAYGASVSLRGTRP